MVFTVVRRKDLRGARWERLRAVVIERDGRRCQACGKFAAYAEVDHKVPVFKGGLPHDLDNLQTLCRACHIDKTRIDKGQHDPERAAWRAYLR